MAARVSARRRAAGEERVTALELFFDLVFVFALTQVTRAISDDPTARGLGQGLLVLGVLWWAWAAYAWLTSTVDPEESVVRVVMFAAMAAALIASLAVPGAFGDDALTFAVAYIALRLLHLVLYGLAGRGDHDLAVAIRRLVPSTIVNGTLLVLAASTDGALQGAAWAVALGADLLGPYVGGMRGYRIAAGHFAERHALIVIIALGESIVAVGVGASGIPLDAGVIVAALLGMTVAAALWWAYFDVVALVAERRLRDAPGEAQLRLARDSYSYLHLPMVAGIVVFAVGVKKTLAHVGDPLEVVPAVALCGGPALYYAAHVLFRLRNVRSLSRRRVVVVALLVAAVPIALEVPALAALGIVAALSAGLVAYETIRFAEDRARVRATLAEH